MAEILLKSLTGTSFIRERIFQLSPPNAKSAMVQIGEAPTTCGTFTITDPTLGIIQLTVVSLGAPVLGDATVALRITLTTKSLSDIIYENIVAIQLGGTIILITHTSAGTISDALTSEAASKAYAKMRATW